MTQLAVPELQQATYTHVALALVTKECAKSGRQAGANDQQSQTRNPAKRCHRMRVRLYIQLLLGKSGIPGQ